MYHPLFGSNHIQMIKQKGEIWLWFPAFNYTVLKYSLAEFISPTRRCDMAFIEPMHHNKPNIIYLLISDKGGHHITDYVKE